MKCARWSTKKKIFLFDKLKKCLKTSPYKVSKIFNSKKQHNYEQTKHYPVKHTHTFRKTIFTVLKVLIVRKALTYSLNPFIVGYDNVFIYEV